MSELNVEILSELGSLTCKLRSEVSKIVKEGIGISEIINFLEIEIFKRGFLPSFPAMVSVNSMAAHYTIFDEDYILQKGDVIKIDFGISKDGFMTDNAFTVEVDSNEHQELIETAKKCLDGALEVMELGVSMSEVGAKVYEIAKSAGFNTIHNLTGHQIGRYELHYGLCVPNLDNGDTRKISDGQQFAVEPFITYGSPKVKAFRPSNILHLTSKKPVRDIIAKKVLKHIVENYPFQPFSKRWLVDSVAKNLSIDSGGIKGYDFKKINYAISVLKRNGNIYEYDELGTVDGSLVAQFEDCVLFNGGKKIIITRLEDSS